MSKNKQHILIFGLLVSSIVIADEINCPKNITILSQEAKPEAGWQVIKSGSLSTLKGANIYSGHPSNKMSEMYHQNKQYTGKDGRKVDEYIWALEKIKDPWIECIYTVNSLHFARSLGGHNSCVSSERAGVVGVDSVICK